MDFNVFPSIMKEKLSIEMKKEIDAVNSNQQSALKSAKQNKKVPPIRMLGFLMFIGLFAGILLAWLIVGDSQDGYVATVLWTCIIISEIICIIIYSKLVLKARNYNNDVDNRTTLIEKNYETRILAIKKNYDDRKSEFTKYFEDGVQKKSIKFADSQLAKEVIDWMFNGFSNSIEKADRSIHIKVLDIPFKFKVFQNRITCNLGVYDFKVHRCENLQNPIEQSALARAIASSIQLKLVMQYSVDPSGTKASAELINNYGSDYIESTIRYIADNGDYQEVKQW